jgi:1,4-alpha-glucan branching enzyme
MNRMDRIDSGPEETRALDALLAGSLNDPFAVLGPHHTSKGRVVRTFLPGALSVEARSARDGALIAHLAPSSTHEGVFTVPMPDNGRYILRIQWPGGEQETEDPYAFGPVLSDLDLHLFSEGTHWDLAHRFGANVATVEGVEGVSFAVWAPNARRVSVVGPFNNWDGRRHIMRLRHSAGVWELFIPRLRAGERYNYEIAGSDGTLLPLKSDPLARTTERPPATASVVAQVWSHCWTDADWMARRARAQAPDAPISIYEVHAGSWRRPEGEPRATLDWRGLAQRLIPYVSALGFTHVEFLPIMEHPFGGSWGYQPLSLFAPSARYGEPQGFAHFVDACHAANIGVILDWVPAHFPNDPHGLGLFDGTALYEHADPREGVHRDWNTLIYNFGRREVQAFLIASALYWLKEFHIDGLRVDAVASMLYRDYSRDAGQWIPNRYGGRENLEAVQFVRRLNELIAERAPGAITIAEESTSWPGVTAPVCDGGLGFTYKWNMGWMHDTLGYLAHDPVHRRWHHDALTFGLLYAFSERFILPLSHDEVVYGKGSIYGRAPGDPWQKLANLRAYYAFMWTHPGKKLLFMGNEIGQRQEWSHDGEIAWDILQEHGHTGLQLLVRDLNRFYASERALHGDCDPHGFRWIIGDDADQSVYAYERTHPGARPVIAIINMTPVPRENYRLGVPIAGGWREILNTDSAFYGGSDLGNGGWLQTEPSPAHGFGQSLLLMLPPLAALILKPES